MKPHPASTRFIRWPLILAGLTAVTGICLSVYLRSRIAQTEAVAARLSAETLRLNTEQELALFGDVLESVCALHALSDAVNQAAMDEFIEKGMVYQHAVLGAFGLTQRINPWLRTEIEGRENNQPGAYRIVQQGPEGTWIPAELKPIYYPLTWQSRTNGLNVPVGFDFASLGEAARSTIQQIERTRRPALVPAPDSFSKNAGTAYWVFAPVMSRPVETGVLYAPNAVIGFAVAVLHPDAVLQRVTAFSTPSARLRLKLAGPADAQTGETIRLENSTWFYRSPLEAIGTQWIFECSLPVTLTGQRSTAALVIGLFITVLMTSQLLLLGKRTQQIEARVRARTEDLHVANARLEENLRERARLEEEMNELAAREQRRIGRDLHDSLGQKLTGAVFLSRSLLDYFSQNGGEQQTHARTLNETLKSAVAQVRNMARGLAPVTLSDESLSEALGQLAEEMTGLYGVSCEVAECAGLSSLDRKIKEQLYLIAREAVNNAARHAQAGHVIIRLTGDESGWKLCIEDDGKGLPEIQPAGEGMGIRIMRHRAGLIGAGFTIRPAPDKGTCIEVTKKEKV